jgi:hypothetical protein
MVKRVRMQVLRLHRPILRGKFHEFAMHPRFVVVKIAANYVAVAP